MKNEDIKGGLNDCYKEKTPPVATHVVITKVHEILFSTHKKHDGALYVTRKGHIILR